MIFVKFTKTTGFKKAYMPKIKAVKNEPLQYQMLINFLVLDVHLKVTHTQTCSWNPCYKTITSKNVSSEAQFKNFFIL